MKQPRLFITILCLLLFLSIGLSAPLKAADPVPLLIRTDPAVVIRNLEARIPELMNKARIPGLQLALIREGKIVWQGCFGVKNAENRQPVGPDTLFEAASLTKPFFAYAVMKLVDEGIIDLDKPLIEYLPRELVDDELGHSLEAEGFKKEWFVRITGRQVLSHSSGMPHGEREKIFPLFFEPGTKYKYSATGYYFLQKVVELRLGKKLETVMKEYVLDPLGMKKSCLVWRPEYEKTMASGHGFFNRPEAFRKRTTAHAAASLYTTAEEYGRFICAVMNGEGLKPETHKMMLTPVIDVDREMGVFWSLGFGIQRDANGPAFWQWGDYGIFRNYILAYPAHKTAVVYLTNSHYGLSICPELISLSLGGQALGNAQLGYKHYDYPLYDFAWKVKAGGAGAVRELYPVLKKRLANEFDSKRIDWIGSVLTDEKMFDEAIAFFEMNLKDNSQSPTALSRLARALLEKGDRNKAAGCYRKALKLKQEESFDPKKVEWALTYIKALEQPLKLEADYLKRLAGDYGPRHIKLEGGTLYYFRKNTDTKDYKALHALSRDTFIMEHLIYFRLKFEFDDRGEPIRIIGLLEWGDRDVSERDK